MVSAVVGALIGGGIIFVPVETKPHKICEWLQSPRLSNVEGSEVTIVDTDEISVIETEKAVFRVFFPGVEIEDADNLTDLHGLAKKQLGPDDCDVWPSDKTGWLIVKGYASDDVVFVGRFYSEEQFGRVCKEKAKFESAKFKPVHERPRREDEQTSRPEVESRAEVCYKRANEYYERGDFAKAIDLYSEAIRFASDDDAQRYRFYYNRGLALCCLERYAEGKQDILKVLELRPTFAEGWYIKGLADEYLNDVDGAIEAYEKALELNPDFKDAQNRKELAQAKRQKPKLNCENSGHYRKNEIVDGQIRSIEFWLPKESLSSIGGLDSVKKELRDNIVLPMRRPDLFVKHGKERRFTVLLYGPPGCGKTLLAKAVAGEVGCYLGVVGLHELIDKWSGNTEKNIHEIFEQARTLVLEKKKKCVIFLDEFDAVGTKREFTNEFNGSRAVNQLLAELDGIEDNPEDMFIIAATNRPWDVDPALKRSRRFGEQIYVPAPSKEERKKIFELYITGKNAANIDFDRLADVTEGYSAGDIWWIQDAAKLAPVKRELEKRVESTLEMNDILALLADPIKGKGTLREWCLSVKDEFRSKPKKEQNLYKLIYKPMFDDIERLLQSKDPETVQNRARIKIKREEAKRRKERDRTFRPAYVK